MKDFAKAAAKQGWDKDKIKIFQTNLSQNLGSRVPDERIKNTICDKIKKLSFFWDKETEPLDTKINEVSSQLKEIGNLTNTQDIQDLQRNAIQRTLLPLLKL